MRGNPPLCVGGLAEALGVELLPLLLLLHRQLLALVRRGEDVEEGVHAVWGDDEPCGGGKEESHQDVEDINQRQKPSE